MGDPEVLKAMYKEVMENQIRDNTPPETNITFQRLQDAGITKEEATNMILDCIQINIFDAFKSGEAEKANKDYISNLKNLPNSPFE